MSLLSSWDDGPGVLDEDTRHRELGEAVVGSMFDVNAGGAGPGDEDADDAFLQEAILEHAKF